MLDPVRPKVRHKFKMVQIRKDINMISIIMIVTATIAGNVQFTDAVCDKTPEKSATTMPRMSGNNGFAIGIVGSPKLYRPGQQYTLTLEGAAEGDNDKPTFTNFFLAAEPVSTSPAHFTPTGTMEIRSGDPMVMYSSRCRNSIKESSSSVKDAISVYWTAPSEHELMQAPHGSSGCLEFRAMVIARQDVWFMNDGALTYPMCKDTSFVSPSELPDEVEPCSACTEAKYELIFEGIWSRHTHPKDFPVDEWRTQFSKLIGASHSNPNKCAGNPACRLPNGYSMWSYSTPASLALETLATHGITRRLESQMKGFSQDIRSVIKARGLEQRSNVAGQTFAVFRVDPVHHLLTFVTKMIPSPDWIVGVSNENLCLANGSWTDHRTIDLYPADAGVDSGLKYNSPRFPTEPREKVRRITSGDPDNPDSPFWDEHRAPMKPVARLHIIKQREYRKTQCQGNRGVGNRGIVNPSWNMNNPNFGGSGDGGDTYVARQGNGIGPPSNQENYADYGRSEDTDYSAISPVSEYNDYDNEDNYRQTPRLFTDDPCMTTDWAVWSQCSQTCGKAGNSQNRIREFMDIGKANANQCSQKIELSQKQPCRHLQDCPPKRYGNTFNPFPNGNDNGGQKWNSYTSTWEQRGIQSGAQRRPDMRQSYVYPSASNNDVVLNRQTMSGRGRGNGPSRGNIGQGMYGYGNNHRPTNQAYETPVSYEYGGGVRGSQADEVSHELPQQARYQGLPQGDGSSPTVGQTCDVSIWGEWSECSSECDSGSKTRNRHYISQGNFTSGNCGEELSERVGCVGNGVNCPSWQQPNVVRSGFGGYGFNRQSQVEELSEDCATADWSEWSPCSDKCSQGSKRRTRLYTKAFVDYPRSCDVQLIESQICWGDNGGIGCRDNYGSSNYDQISYRNDQNYMYSNVEIEPLEEENQVYSNQILSQVDKCSLDMNNGAPRCVSHYTRWYYDRVDGQCKEFVYKGCGGNQNNFESKDLCMSSCSEEQVNGSTEQNEDLEEMTMRTLDYNGDNNGLASESLIRLTPEEENRGVFNPPRMGRPPKPIDCQASAWSEWTSCSKTCGSGWTTRDRDILVNAGPGGRTCPRKLHRKRKCRLMPCPANTKYWYNGSWRHIGQD